ncbi:MAG: hypothetical protein ACREDR_25655 [Blastocatellia bacterium]
MANAKGIRLTKLRGRAARSASAQTSENQAPVISFDSDASTIEAVLRVIRRLLTDPNGALPRNPKHDRSNGTGNGSAKGDLIEGRRQVNETAQATRGGLVNGIRLASESEQVNKGRWPLEMLQASGGGLMALRVQKGAGLEAYGISDLDVLLVGFDDPERDDPAMVAIDGKIVIGRFRSEGRGRVVVAPFVRETPPVVVRTSEVQVACALKGVVRWLCDGLIF